MTTQKHTPTTSVYCGLRTTHVARRDDAVIHNGRDYVPTIYGQESGNTVWVEGLKDAEEKGATFTFNEDQTEIWLTLPVGHKFSTQMFRKDRIACNAHDELVTIIEEELELWSTRDDELLSQKDLVRIAKLRAVLAKARGE